MILAKRCLALVLLALAPQLTASSPGIPFGSHSARYAPHIRPGEAQARMDSKVRAFYDAWKARYLEKKCVSSPQHYRINFKNGQTVSEAHGYGMLAMVLMAGHDPQAREIFDGMVHYYKAHPATEPPASRLMAWKQDRNCRDIEGASTASDGDLDIALSLLMADRQWGSCSGVNYLAEARAMLAQIRQYEVGGGGKFIRLGNWAVSGKHLNATRISDFMPGHFRSFQWASGDLVWKGVIEHGYGMIAALARPRVGLVPDFAVNVLEAPKAAPGGFLEDSGDGNYDYNACRVPWRLATDYLGSGEARARVALQSIAAWMKSGPIRGQPGNVKAGYSLSGNATADWDDFSFSAPFTLAAMCDAQGQAMLDAFWGHISGPGTVNYFGDSIKLLCMIVASGNWWRPEAMRDPCAQGKR